MVAWTGKRRSRAAILAEVDRYRRAAGQHPLRIGVVMQERPDLYAAVRKVGATEILATIGASIDPIDGASEDKIRIARVGEDGKRLDLA